MAYMQINNFFKKRIELAASTPVGDGVLLPMEPAGDMVGILDEREVFFCGVVVLAPWWCGTRVSAGDRGVGWAPNLVRRSALEKTP